MLETMHYDVHLAKEQDLLTRAEMRRRFLILKSGRKRDSASVTVFNSIWLIMYGGLKQLRQLVDSITVPGHHRLNTGK